MRIEPQRCGLGLMRWAGAATHPLSTGKFKFVAVVIVIVIALTSQQIESSGELAARDDARLLLLLT